MKDITDSGSAAAQRGTQAVRNRERGLTTGLTSSETLRVGKGRERTSQGRWRMNNALSNQLHRALHSTGLRGRDP